VGYAADRRFGGGYLVVADMTRARRVGLEKVSAGFRDFIRSHNDPHKDLSSRGLTKQEKIRRRRAKILQAIKEKRANESA
jgi:hypothetical protein